MIEAYPLQWPSAQPRVSAEKRRTGYQFKVSQEQAQRELLAELRRMGATDAVVSTNIPVRRDGLYYADAKEPTDPAVAVYFTHGKRQLVIACDSYSKVRWNLRACGATVEALRTIQRHGATELLERAFTGFTALPPKGGEQRPWWEALGVNRAAPPEEVKAAYRRLAAMHHPDRGGDAETWLRITRAWDAAREEGAAE